MGKNMENMLDTAVQRNVAASVRGAVGALADTQAKMIATLLEHGSITSVAAQQMITQLHNTEYSNAPQNDAEQVKRHFVR
ncbi:MAG: hypothetical protein OXH76_01275 [Boseongicola sp.]|nr:hypothetical protein [Boseongicola sp.]